MSMSQKRQPKGIPVGGEFAENSHDEATTALSEPEPEPYNPVYTVPISAAGEFEDRIERANARLARSGIEERFTLTRTDHIMQTQDGVFVEVADFTLSKPRISAGDWSFESTHEMTENGHILSYYSGDDDTDREPVEDMSCEQCGVNRRREKVYRVRNRETGEVKQIGGSCLNVFTGIKPQGLWALTYDPNAEDLEYDEEDDYGFLSYSSPVVIEDRQMILATIRAVAENGGKYVSKNKAGFNEKPTSEVVKGQYVALSAEPATAEEREEIDAVLAYVRALDDSTEFNKNLRTVFIPDEEGRSFIRGKHLGIAAYAVESRRRAIRQAEEKRIREESQANKVQGYLAEKGVKIADLRKGLKKEGKDDVIRARVLGVRAGEPSYYNGVETYPYHVNMLTDDGHVVYWRASSAPSVNDGDRITIDGGTVKETRVSDYNGDWETVLTRAKLSLIEE